MTGKLILQDGSTFEGTSFGAQTSTAGEVVFSTGMVGYPESLTDPSYLGQILILTYPLIGNYGIPDKNFWESDSIKVSGLIVSNYIDTPSHAQSKRTLADWLKEEKIPALEIADTRFLTQKIRTKGTMLGKIILGKDLPFYDPDKENLVAKVSTHNYHATVRGSYVKTILLFDCGAKKNIERCLVKKGIRVITVPWDYDPFSNVIPNSTGVILNSFQDLDRTEIPKQVRNDNKQVQHDKIDAIIISNGPGNPKMAGKTIQTIKKAIDRKIPTLGVCLGHQLLTLAAGGDTYKLKFGHRSQNQPCILKVENRLAGRNSALQNEGRCYITTQNHGFAVNKIPKSFKSWFVNANDGSNEGIIHDKLPIMSVQFHPEANPGPNDTEWVFDFFLEKIK